MKLLAIDTATAACSVAVADGSCVLAVQYDKRPKAQSQHLLSMIRSTLLEAGLELSELEALTLTIGPGSFVGLRLAVGVLQGLAYVHQLPVIPVSTLQWIAQSAYRQHRWERVFPVLDAHMGQLYVGDYKSVDGLVVPVQEDALLAPGALRFYGLGAGVGEGWSLYEDLLAPVKSPLIACEPGFLPEIQDLVPLALGAFQAGKTVSALALEPVYLRGSGAWKQKSRAPS